MRICPRSLPRLPILSIPLVLLALSPLSAPGQLTAPTSYEVALQDEIARAETAAKAAPTDAALQARLSQSYSVANRPREALQAMEQALARDPTNPAYLKARAELANWVGRPGVAADSYERMLQVDPAASTNTLLLLARARTWNGDLDRAAAAYRQWMSQKGEQPDVLMEYLRVEAWRGNFAHALALLDRYEKNYGRSPATDKERARILATADRPRAAMAINEPLVQANPADFELQFTRTVALHYDRQPGAAATNLDTLARLRPDSPEGRDLRDFVAAGQRPDLTAQFRYYFDNDDLKIWREAFAGGAQIQPETRLKAGLEYDQLYAKTNSGLENIDGSRDEKYAKFWLGLRHIIAPALTVEGTAGYADLGNTEDEIFIYRMEVDNRPFDSLQLALAQERDYLLISPRSASLAITRATTSLSADWIPDLLYTVSGIARYDDYSDGNQRGEAILGPRRSVLRSERFNLDLGVRGLMSGFTEDRSNGYYDPELYQQYALTAFGYWKITPQSGLGVVGAAGYYKDDTMAHYDPGWSADAEATFGAFSSWMLKINGSAFENFRSESGPFEAYALGASLTRRF